LQNHCPESPNTKKTSGLIGAQLVIPLDPSSSAVKESAVKNLDSRRSEKDAALKDARSNIIITHKILDGKKKLYALIKTNFDQQVAQMDLSVKKIQNGEIPESQLPELLQAVRQLSGQFEEMTSTQELIVDSLFSLHQTTGLLFTKFAVSH
jgi:hypothetical protein